MTPSHPATPTSRSPGRPPWWQLALAAVAVAAQGLVLAGTFLLILGWFDVWFGLALLQAGGGLALAVAWAPRRPLRALAVPVVSLLLTLALFAAANLQARVLGCSRAELAAVGQLAPPPGTDVQFRGEMSPEGCVARFTSGLSPQELLDHYEAQLAARGWSPPDGSATEFSSRRGDHVLTVSSSPREDLVIVTIG